MFLQEELDIKVLQFQNKKLAERIEQRRKAEDDLRKRIEQLEQRQTTDDAVLCIVNRYWNQVLLVYYDTVLSLSRDRRLMMLSCALSTATGIRYY